MNFHFDEKTISYTGKELKPLRNYLEYGLLGNSVASWVGPCNVSFDEMVDGEDVRGGHAIAADSMLHFVMELFDVQLSTGVLLQRLFAQMIIDELASSSKPQDFLRNGDDVFYKGKKLNISIATRSVNSVLLHVGINVTNNGTPIETSALTDLGVQPQEFSLRLMKRLALEWQDVLNATYKVRSV